MNPHDEDELPLALLEGLRALPRERHPGRMLEERTVRSLRAEGLLQPPAAPRRLRFPAAWLASAAAACVALFAGGVTVGQWMSMRSVERMQAENARQAALLVQQTGAAYVGALARLGQVADTAGPAQRQQAREVAVQALRAAANELVRLAPDDPVASGILAGFDRARAAREQPDSSGRTPQVVWF